MNRGKPVHGYRIVRGKLTAAQADALADVRAALSSPGSMRLARGNTRGTVLLGGLREVWKQYHHIGSREAVRALRGDTCVRREFDNNARALHIGFPAPCPLFAAERRCFGILTGQIIAFQYVENGFPLREAVGLRELRGPYALNAEERLDLLRRYGSLLATMHRVGVRHGDLHSDNVLVARSGGSVDLWLLDWLKADFADPIGEDSWRKELSQAAGALLRVGVSLAEAHAFYSAYCDALGWPITQRRKVGRWLVRRLRAGRPHLVTRTLRTAMAKGHRFVSRLLADGRALYVLRSETDRAAAALAARGHAGPAGLAHCELPRGIELRDDANAVETWKAACVCERFRLPCRRVLGVAVGGKRDPGQLAMEEAGGIPLDAELQEPGTRASALDDLKALVVLLHSFGLRFHDCCAGTIYRAGPMNPIATQRSRGLVVQDPSVLRAQPKSGTQASWDAVAAYVASQCGPEEGAVFAPRAR